MGLWTRLALSMLCLLAGGRASALASQSKPYQGKTLRVLSFQDSHARAVAAHVTEFEELTGAKVVFDAIASHTVAAKVGTDQASGGSYDLYAVDEPFMPQLAPFFLPLSAWPRPRILDPGDGELGRFLPSTVKAGVYQSVPYGLPVNGNVYLYVYRKDLFEDPEEQRAFRQRHGYELKAPATVEQLRDVAAFFTRPPKLYGFAPFTRSSEGTTVEAIWILRTFGVDLLGEDGRAPFDERQAVAALAYYREMMKFAPPGAGNWHHAERMSAYAKGRVVQVLTWPSFLKDLENPEKSLVAGRNGFASPPGGRSGRAAPVSGSWTLAIPKSSRVPELAAEFAHWWASRSFGKRLVAAGMNPARRDLLQDPDLVRQFPWFPAVLASFESAVVRPRFPEYKRLSDVISRHFTELASGQATPEEAVAGLRAALAARLAKRRPSL